MRISLARYQLILMSALNFKFILISMLKVVLDYDVTKNVMFSLLHRVTAIHRSYRTYLYGLEMILQCINSILPFIKICVYLFPDFRHLYKYNSGYNGGLCNLLDC